MDFSKRLTDNARDVLAHSEVIARSSGSAYIGTEHLLLGILSQEQSTAAELLRTAGITFDRVRQALQLVPPAGVDSLLLSPTRGFSETAKLTMRMSVELASEFHQDYCGTEHILFSLLSQKNARAATVLADLHIDSNQILADLEDILDRKKSDFRDEEAHAASKPRSTRGSFLSKFARNLNNLASSDELDPVIGRDKEIERMITILTRRTKNNPVLIGEAGVGKTAIVEGLAQRINDGTVPSLLTDKKVWQLDLAGMVAGTKYRGEFEERLGRLLDEVKADRNVIIFIDELHLLTGAGSAEGSMDAANILKPALARGEFRLIGATTLDEYRKNIEKDSALTRRFQTITVNPPNSKDTIRILTGIAPKYEDHHHVKLSAAVIDEAVRLSDRYLPERQQPDKAIDVIDEAAARVNIARKRSDKPVELKTYQREIARLNEHMEDAVATEDYERAALYKMRISRLHEKIAEVEKTDTSDSKVTLKINDVAAAVSAMTHIPLEQLERSETKKLAGLEKHLSKHVIGQRSAITAVSRAIRRSRVGIAASQRPIGSFVFLGPTGVGKTELARVLAREVFGSDKNLIKVDMSEFSERHTASRLVGAPAGYVGYEDGGHLTEKIRRQPYSVVLFDEIEKAHPQVFNLLLQILEDGTLTDGHGRTVDFSNTVIILTSNVGAEEMTRENILGFDARTKNEKGDLASIHQANQSAGEQKLREIMRPELLNRFDAIITFDSLSRPEVTEILDLMIEDFNRRLASKGVAVTLTLKAKRHLIAAGYNPKFGARPLRRAVSEQLEDLVAEKLLAKSVSRGDILQITAENGQLVVGKLREQPSYAKK
ncbi:MAG TPA: ATP-dependent Clp protease ATP-binding subunit [Candidatus Nanoperiomorbaceae bacterium]|jgi:ATP-dependent Clp protease ATP-binding subunit ClpC|nr:ATP-dependent Clp protease ATP-binding subunit [Candidatus Nanoperiomorbaceae bacterium]HMR85942.1 ATP-dependent Clp protease ATP-binding subunit [Candidatus Nanoperiomorbaceae bacterium]HMU11813.1 ATP-dependent Clp protease ATP-binding subunit [Candidatus Nanoperiomorbaceae bacterium]